MKNLEETFKLYGMEESLGSDTIYLIVLFIDSSSSMKEIPGDPIPIALKAMKENLLSLDNASSILIHRIDYATQYNIGNRKVVELEKLDVDGYVANGWSALYSSIIKMKEEYIDAPDSILKTLLNSSYDVKPLWVCWTDGEDVTQKMVNGRLSHREGESAPLPEVQSAIKELKEYGFKFYVFDFGGSCQSVNRKKGVDFVKELSIDYYKPFEREQDGSINEEEIQKQLESVLDAFRELSNSIVDFVNGQRVFEVPSVFE